MDAKLSILTFPQRISGNVLTLNVLIIPRNLDPLLDDGINALSPAWVNANLRLNAVVINSADDYPRLDLPSASFDLPGVTMNSDASSIFNYLNHPDRFTINSTKKAPPPVTTDYVRKYLPVSYRQAFNFTTPRTSRADIGDAYQCAIKDTAEPVSGFKNSDEVSWGKIFAFCLRQPDLAAKCGFIHTNIKITLPGGTYKNGGWLYVDHHPESSYAGMDKALTRRYAARIPKIKDGTDNVLFAAIQFPVLLDAVAGPDKPSLPTMLDEIQIEAAAYNDGFCKIIHSNQPVSSYLLHEEEDEEEPVITDMGIRLGWDDEQLLIWMNRQMEVDTKLPGVQRADVPLGVFQYRVDGRITPEDENAEGGWNPLCRVKYDKAVAMGDVHLSDAGKEIELGVEVYPSKPDASPNAHYWLPSYFAQWIGKSLVLQDTDAISIYQKDKQDNFDPADPVPVKRATKYNNYLPAGLENITLLYGNSYQFRVRMADITGGGPLISDKPRHDALSPVTKCFFKRFVVPQTVRFITPLPQADDAVFSEPVLSLQRPLLGYPAVLYTGSYTDAIQLLKEDAALIIEKDLRRDVGLPDPDVNRVEILVEIKGLNMDSMLPKADPKDSYAIFYKTERTFAELPSDKLDIPVTYADAPVISFSGNKQLSEIGIAIPGENDIDKRQDIVLPTSRDIRITIRAICVDKADYYGGMELKEGIPANRLTLHGMKTCFTLRKEASMETSLFKAAGDHATIRGIYLQPEEPVKLMPGLIHFFVGSTDSDRIASRMIERLAGSIDAASKGLSIMGNQGERWQFGVSRLIRHTASPDNTSVTFSTRADMLNQWLIPVTLLLNRDWSWDGFKPVGLKIFRRKIFLREAMQIMGYTDRDTFMDNVTAADVFKNVDILAVADEYSVGDIEVKRTINIHALTDADRSQTHICFIDAVEPKTAKETDFPDQIFVAYRITYSLKNEDASKDQDLILSLSLPITSIPAQIPKIVSAGLAYSRYVRDESYANTEARKKFLWIEFDKPVADPDDAYFVRMLAYAADPLLASWKPELFRAVTDPPLPIDPEPIRNISPSHSNDRAGLNAMQELIKANDSDHHYIVPLPSGLHPESPELFGFFTLEFRVGHKKSWSTAQARFGRSLRTTGVQFPTPQLFCVTNRNELSVTVTAPFAEAVYGGKNVTSTPPRTELWALLYAQVRMADNSDNRNILIADRKLMLRRNQILVENGLVANIMNSDANPLGYTSWSNKDIESLLRVFGLPEDSPLSILCVEVFPGYDKFTPNQAILKRRMSEQGRQEPMSSRVAAREVSVQQFETYLNVVSQSIDETHSILDQQESGFEYGPRPLTDDLGSYRILRTSTLAVVPEVCCTE